MQLLPTKLKHLTSNFLLTVELITHIATTYKRALYLKIGQPTIIVNQKDSYFFLLAHKNFVKVLYMFVRPIYLSLIERLSGTVVQIEITDLFVKFSEVF